MKMGNVDFIKRLVFSKRIKKYALRMANFVIAVQGELIRELNFNGEYVVLPCGVDLDLFRPIDKIYCRKKLKLPLNRKIIFFPASPTNTNKGIDILMEGIKYLGRDDIYLLTAGSIHHEEMPYYMCASDAVVQLSDYEASPMVVKEALATNVPTLFTEVGDVKSTIGNTVGCFLCERVPEDVALKLENVINFNGQSGGRKRIMEYGMGLSDVAKRIITIYSDLLNKG
jgi:glycosyltransferase involved in cell wall biosynthesis